MVIGDHLLTLIPGYCQGVTKVIITYPCDVIKIKLQTNTYPNMYLCIKDLLKNNPKIFLRGISIPLIVFPIDRAISYKIYEDLNKQRINPYISAFIGGITSSIFNVPMQYITTNAIHMSREQYQGITHLILDRIKSKNNLFRGYTLDTSRAVFGSTIFLGTYGNLKNKLPDTNIYTIASSMISISITWLITFPLDLIRVNQQITKNTSIYELIEKTYRCGGLRGFYRGLNIVLMRSIPATVAGMMVYEKIKKSIMEF